MRSFDGSARGQVCFRNFSRPLSSVVGVHCKTPRCCLLRKTKFGRINTPHIDAFGRFTPILAILQERAATMFRNNLVASLIQCLVLQVESRSHVEYIEAPIDHRKEASFSIFLPSQLLTAHSHSLLVFRCAEHFHSFDQSSIFNLYL
jgi:hypothetical protein